MAWADLDAGFREICERVCTRSELEVLARVAEGDGMKKIAREMGVARGTVQVLRRRAERKIQTEVYYQRGYDTGRR